MSGVLKESAYVAVKEAYQRASLEAAFHHNWVKAKDSDEWKVQDRRTRLQKSVEQAQTRRRSVSQARATQESDSGDADPGSMDYENVDKDHVVPQPVSRDSVEYLT